MPRPVLAALGKSPHGRAQADAGGEPRLCREVPAPQSSVEVELAGRQGQLLSFPERRSQSEEGGGLAVGAGEAAARSPLCPFWLGLAAVSREGAGEETS